MNLCHKMLMLLEILGNMLIKMVDLIDVIKTIIYYQCVNMDQLL